MNETFNESVNIAIMENETSAADWALSDLAFELYWWADFFNIGCTVALISSDSFARA